MVNLCTVTRVPTHTPDTNTLTPDRVDQVGAASGLMLDSIDNGAHWDHGDPRRHAWLAWRRMKNGACLDTIFTVNHVDFTPPLRNVMSYYGCAPMEFSPDQLQAIEYHVRNGRGNIPTRHSCRIIGMP